MLLLNAIYSLEKVCWAGANCRIAEEESSRSISVRNVTEASLIDCTILNTSASPAIGLLYLARTSGALWKMSVVMPSLVVNDNQAAKIFKFNYSEFRSFKFPQMYEAYNSNSINKDS